MINKEKFREMYASKYISEGIYRVPLYVLTNFKSPDGFSDYTSTKKLEIGIDKLIIKFKGSDDYVEELITGIKIPIGYFYTKNSGGITAYIYDKKNKTPYFTMVPFICNDIFDNRGFWNGSRNLLDCNTNKLDNIMKEYMEKHTKNELEKMFKDILETTTESYNKQIEDKKSNYEKYFSDSDSESELDNTKQDSSQDSSNSRFVNNLQKHFKKNKQK